MVAGSSWALSPETAMLLDLLQAKGVISQNEATEFTKTLEGKMAEAVEKQPQSSEAITLPQGEGGGEAQESGGTADILSKVHLSGELAASLTAVQSSDSVGEKTSSSDALLDTALLNVETEINQYVTGRLTFLYEEGSNDDNIALDEAVIGLQGSSSLPLYANIGRQYLPFGKYASRFISDPLPLVLGESNDTAFIAGFANDTLDVNIGGFAGKVKKRGKGETINSAVASLTLTLPKAGSEDVLGGRGGVSYISNLATSNSLEGLNHDASDVALLTPGDVESGVAGWSAFISLSYADQLFFDAEYLAAVNDFAVGDFSFAEAENRRPATWNMELAAKVLEPVEIALRYGGSHDVLIDSQGAPLTSQDEYGVVLLYSIFDSTTIAVEYLYQKFHDASDNRLGTVHLAVEF